MELLDALRQKTGHAFLIEAASREHEHILAVVSKGTGRELAGNPDAYVRQFETLTVEDARTVKDVAATRAVGGTGRVFMISCDSVTAEAQNALLKMLEEPGEGTVFVLVVPRADALLPTVRSRMQRVQWKVAAGQSVLAQEFIHAPRTKRLEMLAGILKGKDQEAAAELLEGLERSLAEQARTKPAAAHALRAIWNARRYAGGSLSKPLLENIALAVPVSH